MHHGSYAPIPDLVVSKADPGCFRTIGEALEHAQPFARIAVRPGLYEEGVLLHKPVAIAGEGALSDIVISNREMPCVKVSGGDSVISGVTLLGLSRLRGPGDLDDSAVHVHTGSLTIDGCDITSTTGTCISISGSKSRLVIQRSKIHDGHSAGVAIEEHAEAIIDGCEICGNKHPGVLIARGSSSTIRQCSLHHGRHHGIVIRNSKATIEDCDIYENREAGVVLEGGDAIVRRCRIHDGRNAGIGFWEESRGTVEDCEFFGNNASGLVITQRSNPVVRHCHFHDGVRFGVYVSMHGQGTLADCDISTSDHMGIMIEKAGNPLVRRCRIHHQKFGGAWIHDHGKGTFEECDIYGNANGQVHIGGQGNPTFRRCHIRDGKASGVVVYRGGRGLVEDCMISGNRTTGIVSQVWSDLLVSGGAIVDPTKRNSLLGPLTFDIAMAHLKKGWQGPALAGISAGALVAYFGRELDAFASILLFGITAPILYRIGRKAYWAVRTRWVG